MPLNQEIIKQELIKAGAGAGKTTALINKLMINIQSYYTKYKIFPHVVVSTFTKKATRELKERMLIKAIELKDSELIHYISYSSQLQISTLHGIFNYFIQTNSYKNGFSPGVMIMNEKESDDLFVSILQEVLLEKRIGVNLLNHYSFEELVVIVKHYILHIQTTIHSCPISKKEMQNVCLSKEIVLSKEFQKNSAKIQKELLELQAEKDQIDTFHHLSIELEKLGKEVFRIQLQKKKGV